MTPVIRWLAAMMSDASAAPAAGDGGVPSDAAPVVGIVMGSESDLDVMEPAAQVLAELRIPCEVRVVSAHRTPVEMIRYGETAADRGLRVIIAGAGGAAHLPGMLAAVTELPVIGVPVRLPALSGLDSLLSIAQMPRGVPVATMAIDGARNAGLLAARILALGDPELARLLASHRRHLADAAHEGDTRVRARGGPRDHRR